jgi:uncharacterized alpha-E superfamily protein
MVMLARSAEDLYWVGRYLERSEHMARTIDVIYHRLLESPEAERQDCWSDALAMTGFPANVIDEIGLDNDALATYCLTGATDGSALDAVHRLRSNSRGNREHLPLELWEEINRFWLEFRVNGTGPTHASEWCSLVRRRCQSIVGTADATWIRSDAWTYFTVGRLVERALLTTKLLAVRHHHHTENKIHEWTMTLRCCTALQAHRREYAGFTDARSIIALLMFSDLAPRSVNFCVGHLEEAVDQLGAPADARSRRVIGRLRASLHFGDAFELGPDDVAPLFDEVEHEIRRFAASLAAEFFLLPLENGLRSLRLGASDSLGRQT